jgi:nucleotide-binding universal stress UspA family protein
MLGIRTILLHVDATAASVARLQMTCDLAERHGASVRALFGTGPIEDGASFSYSAGAALDQAAAQRRSVWRDQARDDLQRCVPSDGPDIAWYEAAGDSLARGFALEAAFADLVVLGQQGPHDADDGGPPAGFVETVIVDGGRPTLVMPHTLRSDTIGRRILIAWDGSAPAARAVAGAMPLLQQADEVHAITWSPSPSVAPFTRLGIEAALAEHGIRSVAQRRDARGRVGDELMAMAAELAIDLIVMGCYGHARAAERLLGGATRTALRTMVAPVLMAH